MGILLWWQHDQLSASAHCCPRLSIFPPDSRHMTFDSNILVFFLNLLWSLLPVYSKPVLGVKVRPLVTSASKNPQLETSRTGCRYCWEAVRIKIPTQKEFERWDFEQAFDPHLDNREPQSLVHCRWRWGGLGCYQPQASPQWQPARNTLINQPPPLSSHPLLTPTPASKAQGLSLIPTNGCRPPTGFDFATAMGPPSPDGSNNSRFKVELSQLPVCSNFAHFWLLIVHTDLFQL